MASSKRLRERLLEILERPEAVTWGDGTSTWGDGGSGTSGSGTGEIATGGGLALERVGDLWRAAETIDPRSAGADLFGREFGAAAYGIGTGAPLGALGRAGRMLFFDLETTGLAASDMIFAAGFACWDRGKLRLVQEIATDLAGELELVASAARRIAERPIVVTYNGRSFDLPALRRRLRFHGLPALRSDLRVVDLLLLSRRRYRGRLENHKLATVEVEVMGKSRESKDVPGIEVPLRYRDFVESGDQSHLEPVLYHNRIDLTTMVALQPLLENGQPLLENGSGPADAV